MISTHSAVQRFLLEQGRARMLQKHLAALASSVHTSPWPDGVDSKYDRWHTKHPNKWTPDYIAELARNVRDHELVTTAVTWARQHPEAFQKDPDIGVDTKPQPANTTPANTEPVSTEPANAHEPVSRTEYMRNLMRERRAKAKALLTATAPSSA